MVLTRTKSGHQTIGVRGLDPVHGNCILLNRVKVFARISNQLDEIRWKEWPVKV